MSLKSHLSGVSGLLSAASAAFAGGVSACAGGVCAISAQAAVSIWGAGSATAASGLAAMSSGSYPWWHPQAAQPTDHTTLLLRFALVLLWFSTSYTVSLLAPWRLYAGIAALGGVTISVFELRWLSPAPSVLWAGVALGLLLLLLAPWLPRWNPKRCLDRAMRFTLLLFPAAAFLLLQFLRFGEGRQPCPLCLMQQAALLGIALGVLARRPSLSLAASFFGYASATVQVMEMAQAGRLAHFVSRACASIGNSAGIATSCATAGSQVLLFPIAIDALGLFGLLLALSLFFFAKIHNATQRFSAR